jgi:uncharacterized protein YndB with AHSA1/START domain
MTSDRIEKQVVLRASRARVWRAISDAREFGSWFGMELDAPFTPGATVHGRIVPTKADPTIAAAQKPYEGLPCLLVIDAVEQERRFAFRWHPFAIDPNVDYSDEPMTLVTFELEEAAGGTLLKVTESGFDRVPLERRAKAFEMNEGGWSAQMDLIAKYLAHAA